MKKALTLLLLLLTFLPLAGVADPLDVAGNPQILRVRLPFNSGNTLLGTTQKGILFSEENNYELAPLGKYRIILNSLGTYDLYAVRKGQEHKLGTLSLPFILRSYGNSPVYLAPNWYRGKVVIQKGTTGLIAINYISIEDLLLGALGPLSSSQNRSASIQAASVILRSSLQCLVLESRQQSTEEDYHLNASLIDYVGVHGEKSFTRDLVGQTEGEVLLDAYGNLLCSALRQSATADARPFELIGYQGNTWERNFDFSQIAYILQQHGYHGVHAVWGLERKVLPQSSEIQLAVLTSAGVIDLSPQQAQELFRLPSQFFRIYSFQDQDGKDIVQFLGSLAGFKDQEHQPVYNLVDSLDLLRAGLGKDYLGLLKELYPYAYVARI